MGKTLVTVRVEMHDTKSNLEQRVNRQGGTKSLAEHFEDALQEAVDALGQGFTASMKTEVSEGHSA